MNIGENQFYISQKDNISLDYTTVYKFGTFHVYCGSNTNFSSFSKNGIEIAVLGYMTDSNNIDSTEAQICEWLAQKNENSDVGWETTVSIGGRWVVLCIKNNSLTVWQDACGLRQIFFDRHFPVLASQARYIALEQGYSISSAADEYLQIAKKQDKEYSMPLYATLYDEIERLLPNHCYESSEAMQKRMDLLSLKQNCAALDKPVSASCEILQNQMKTISQKYDLAVTLTAGWDSRVVLSACLPATDKMTAVTLQYNNMAEEHVDIQIAKKLCEKYSLKQDVVKCDPVDDSFMKLYSDHSEDAHLYWMQMEQAILKNKYDTKIWVKGACAEIARNPFGIVPNKFVNAKILCMLFRIPFTDFSEKIVNRWLNETRAFANACNYYLLDLFYWEHRMGSWFAMCINEADCIGETFTPFNVNTLLHTMLSVKRSKRISPHYKFFRKLCNECNMDVKQIPVNPGRYNGFACKLKILVKNRFHYLYAFMLNNGLINMR